MIYSFNENRLCKEKGMIEALGLGIQPVRTRRPVISVVGSGGKTTLLHRLADEYSFLGISTAVTTTTHIWKEDSPFFLENPSMDQILDCLQQYRQVWAGTAGREGKLAGLPPEMLGRLLEKGFPVLIEADGSRRLPAKVPAEHEPVIIPCSTHVVYVCGLDCLGKKIRDVVFRPELAAQMLDKTAADPVTKEDIAELAVSVQAGRKGCPENAVYTVVLNKADNEERIRDALDICRKIKQKGISRVLVTSLKRQSVQEA